MSAVPSANRNRPQDDRGHGPVEQLLSYTEEILEIQARLRRARFFRRLARISMVTVPLGIVGVWVLNALTWHKVKVVSINIPAILIIIIFGIYLAVYLIAVSDSATRKDWNVPQIELDLELAQEKRRFYAATLNLDLQTRQYIYRDDVPEQIDRYRGESKYYRRIHNSLQAVIIIGALSASTLTSLVQSVPQLRWFAVGTTFSVGVAAGFTGYFKFRERSFYLQQTSDSIEQELSAVNLGIGRYKNNPEGDALTEFTEQIEILKVEQRKRQQQLEQPSEGREGVQ